MKTLLIIICITVCITIMYFIHNAIHCTLFKKLKSGDAVWSETKDGMVKPYKIARVDVNENGDTERIHLDNNESYTYDELKKSKYML